MEEKKVEGKGATIVSMEDVKMKYPTGTEALKGINVKISKGEFVFIVGESGSGKSTFVKLLLREVSPTGGKLMVNGKDITHLKHKQVAAHRRRIGCVFQDFRLLKDRTVYENIAFAQKIIGIKSKLIGPNVERIISLVGLSGKEKAYPKELSGGEQQRVALARALVNQPSMLIADEPTGNLDPKNSEEIMRLLELIHAQGTTVIVVTHNQEIVDSMQKRVITIDDGIVARDDEAGTYKRQYKVNYADISQKMEEELLEAAREEKQRKEQDKNLVVELKESNMGEAFEENSELLEEERMLSEAFGQSEAIEEAKEATSFWEHVAREHREDSSISATNNYIENEKLKEENRIEYDNKESENMTTSSSMYGNSASSVRRYRTLAEAMQQGRED